jgi:hypothetical protein
MEPFSLTIQDKNQRRNIRRLHSTAYKLDIHLGSETLLVRKTKE